MMKLIILLLLPLALFSQNNDFYTEDKSVNLFAFIGEKISIEQTDPDYDCEIHSIEIDSVKGDTLWKMTKIAVMDNAYRATYKVIEPVFNKVLNDTIVFIVYDHYGRPDFENYNHVLLYVSKNQNGSFYHQKYQFDPVYTDKAGNWTGIFIFRNVSDFEDNQKAKNFKIKTNVFDEDITNYNAQYVEIAFPKPFYKIKNNIARPVLGASIEELFRLKKENVFQYRELFVKTE